LASRDLLQGRIAFISKDCSEIKTGKEKAFYTVLIILEARCVLKVQSFGFGNGGGGGGGRGFYSNT
jgi:hypothetical protein